MLPTQNKTKDCKNVFGEYVQGDSFIWFRNEKGVLQSWWKSVLRHAFLWRRLSEI